MAELDFIAPATLAEAVAAMADAGSGARALAGGTDLMAQMRSGRLQPALIIDLKRIPELIGVRADSGGFLIGAATPCATLGAHEALARAWPGVVEAACLIGSTQVQGRASLGGNLCNASPAADSVPALVAAGASCLIAGPTGQREAPVESLQSAPGRHSLKQGELLVAIRLPAQAPRSGDAYLRLIPRTEMDIAVVGAAVSLTLDAKGVVSAARVALGAVAPTTVRVDAAADALIGTRLEEPALAALEAAARAACHPIDDKRGTVAYRTQVAGVLARRAALIAYERASK
ncbi:MAG TPA: xanthine dehydrogenase family protein subunit M [Burkholderiaceae bacterium]|nr:xanthine dehydrogenase family protein subunit M [Burkholderiaceae bacterium]